MLALPEGVFRDGDRVSSFPLQVFVLSNACTGWNQSLHLTTKTNIIFLKYQLVQAENFRVSLLHTLRLNIKMSRLCYGRHNWSNSIWKYKFGSSGKESQVGGVYRIDWVRGLIAEVLTKSNSKSFCDHTFCNYTVLHGKPHLCGAQPGKNKPKKY